MVGCSGYGLNNDLNSFWINGDEGCYARGATSNEVYAIAIWYIVFILALNSYENR